MNKKSKFLDAAQKHLQKGAYDKAIKELQKLLEEDPRDVRTLLKIGDIYAKKGDGAEATKTYRRVAEAYSEQGFFLKAVAVYKQILKHEPQNLEVALKLAELYEHLGVMQEAMVQYQIVAGILDQRGNTREWLGVLVRMVDLEPENVASRVRYAEGLSREQRNDEAIAQFVQACELLERQGRMDDWSKVAERLVFLAPARFDILKRLAKHYLASGDLRRAIARLEPCFRGLPRDVETLTLLGRAFREAEHTNKAAYIYKELARVHQEEGRPAEARRAYQAVQELDPADVDAAQALGVEASQRPSRSDVPRSVPPPPRRGSSLRATPPSAPAASPAPSRGSSAAPPRRASSVASQAGPRTPASVAARRAASTAHPTPPGPRLSKETAKLLSEADVYVKYGLREKALDHLKKIVELDPDALDAYAKMRDLYLASRDRPRAADALAYMLRTYRRRGQLDRVEEVRSELAALLPGHPLARAGSDDTDFEAAPSHNDDLDSIDIDVADESADLDFGLGEPAMVASSMPSTGGHQDTSDLHLDEVSGQGESLGEYDILDELPAGGASPMPVFRGQEDDGGFDRVGTDVDGGAAEVDPDTLFEGEHSPSPLDMPLSADAITGAIALTSRDEPLERASQLPEAAVSAPAPGDAELLSLLEGTDDEVAPEDDEDDDPALEADLENVEFLLAQELHEEAREAVLDVLRRHPLHPRAITALDRAEVALGLRDGGPRVTMEPMPDVPGAQSEAMVAGPDPTPGVTDDDDALALFDEASLSNQDPAELATMRPDTNGTVAYESAHDPRLMFEGAAGSDFAVGTDDFSAGATAESEEDIEAVMLADAELTRGYEYQQRGLYAEAIAAYDAATGVPSRAAQAYEMLGICLQAQGDTMGAVTAFYRALETGAPPERAPRLKYEIGMACESASDLENALAWYLSAYADDPTQPHLRARIENLGADPDQALLSQAPPMGATLEPAPAPPEPPPAEAPRPARRNKISYI